MEHTLSGKVQSHAQTTRPTRLKKALGLLSELARPGLLSLLVGSTEVPSIRVGANAAAMMADFKRWS